MGIGGSLYWTILVTCNVPVFLFFGWLIFRSWESFFEALGYAIKPDILSWIQGELGRDWWCEIKLAMLSGACVGSVALEHLAISSLFGGAPA